MKSWRGRTSPTRGDTPPAGATCGGGESSRRSRDPLRSRRAQDKGGKGGRRRRRATSHRPMLRSYLSHDDDTTAFSAASAHWERGATGLEDHYTAVLLRRERAVRERAAYSIQTRTTSFMLSGSTPARKRHGQQLSKVRSRGFILHPAVSSRGKARTVLQRSSPNRYKSALSDKSAPTRLYFGREELCGSGSRQKRRRREWSRHGGQQAASPEDRILLCQQIAVLALWTIPCLK